MIHIDLPAAAECVEKGCEARLSVKLALTIGGTMLARPPHGHGWQFSAEPNGTIVARCPEHHALIEQPRLNGPNGAAH